MSALSIFVGKCLLHYRRLGDLVGQTQCRVFTILYLIRESLIVVGQFFLFLVLDYFSLGSKAQKDKGGGPYKRRETKRE